MLALAYCVEGLVESGKVQSYAEAARFLGVSMARIGQVLALLNLAAGIQERILTGTLAVSERAVVAEPVWEGLGRDMKIMVSWGNPEAPRGACGRVGDRRSVSNRHRR